MSGNQVNPADLRQRQDEVTAGEHTPLVVRPHCGRVHWQDGTAVPANVSALRLPC